MQAFEELYGLLKPHLFRYLLSKVMDRTRAEDLLQDTFLQLHRSRRTFLPGNPVLPWAIGIARHVCLMDLRRTGRRERHETQAGDLLPEIPVLGEAEKLADQEALAKAWAMLPEDRREPLVLHHVEGLTFKEIAEVLGIRVEAAKVRAHRAAKALSDLLAKMTVTETGERQKTLRDQASQKKKEEK